MTKKFWELEAPITAKSKFISHYGHESEVILALYPQSNRLQVVRITKVTGGLVPITKTTTVNLDELSKDPAALEIFQRITELLKSKEQEAKK